MIHGEQSIDKTDEIISIWSTWRTVCFHCVFPTMNRILRWWAWRFISCHLQRSQNWSPKTQFHKQVRFLQASSQKWFRGKSGPPFFQEPSQMHQILRSISGEICHSSHLIYHWIFGGLYKSKVWIYSFIWKLVFAIEKKLLHFTMLNFFSHNSDFKSHNLDFVSCSSDLFSM